MTDISIEGTGRESTGARFENSVSAEGHSTTGEGKLTRVHPAESKKKRGCDASVFCVQEPSCNDAGGGRVEAGQQSHCLAAG